MLRQFNFWSVQSAVWIAFFVIITAAVLPYLGTRIHLESLTAVMANKLALSIAGFVLSSLAAAAYEKTRPALPKLIPALLGFSLVAGNLAIACSNATRMLVQQTWSSHPRDLAAGGTTGVLMLIAWSAGYLALRSWKDAEEARALADRSQLAVLRYQVNPHFLFNSLNTLHSLIREDPARASEAVCDLAAFLRYSLGHLTKEHAPLSEELDALLRYLAVEQARFEEKLEVEVAASRSAAAFNAPGFLLHPLVENAIKHGMQTTEFPLRVHIGAEADNGGLRVTVRNSGHWRSGTNGTGVGLRNLRARLERLYPGRHRLESREVDGWVESLIEIRGV